MATLMVRTAARAALTQEQREALRHVGELVSLGEPALFTDELGNEWAIYDDPRFTLADACRGGRIMANAAGFPDYTPIGRGRDQVHAEDVRFAGAAGVVLPDQVAQLERAENPWQACLEANGAPASLRMAGGLPAGWKPKEGTP